MRRKFFQITACVVILLSLILSSSAFANDKKEDPTSQNSGSAFYESQDIESSALYAYAMLDPEANPNPQGDAAIIKKNIRIINLGVAINHDGYDYAPTISADGRTLFYVSERKGSKLFEGKKSSHDFWAGKKKERLDTTFLMVYNIDTTTIYGDLGVNTQYNEGAASIAADRQSLYFTACNRPGGLGSCDIYKTTIDGDKWGKPFNLGKNVNSDNFDTQPSIAPDQSRLYFVSARVGPNSDGKQTNKDNYDIWYSDYDFDLEEWKPAQNLVALNTKKNESSPFIAADNQTLFFASNGHTPLVGNLDFFFSKYDEETKSWSKPENLGEPINTTEDEQFISLPASGDIIYFSSKREDLAGYQGSLDVFMAFVPTFFKAVNVFGQVVDQCSRQNIPAKVTIKNPITGREIVEELSLQKTELQFVVSNTDYGDPKDNNKFVDFEITAENPEYGKTTIVQRVNRPEVTDDPTKANKADEEVKFTISLGQQPILDTEIGDAEFAVENQADPKFKGFNGLLMLEVSTWDLYPLLNYVFFDEGSAEFRDRYIRFNNFQDIKDYEFSDTTIPGGTLDKYYHILNIYGFRLTQFPDTKIDIVGCNDGTTLAEKKDGLSKARAELVYNYFKDVWQIDPSRMNIVVKGKPNVISNLKDSLGIQENRRVEIISNSWEIMKPIFDKDPKIFPQPENMKFNMVNGIQSELIKSRRIVIDQGVNPWITLKDVGKIDESKLWDWKSAKGQYPKESNPESFFAKLVITTQNDSECESDPIEIPVIRENTEKRIIAKGADSTNERYNLILFPFDKSVMGPTNERIMKEYVYNRCFPTSRIEVIGHTDVVGLYDHNQRLSQKRSSSVFNDIQKTTAKKYGALTTRGVGEDEPLYSNDTPEGRFYNRTVQVIIKTPNEDAK